MSLTYHHYGASLSHAPIEHLQRDIRAMLDMPTDLARAAASVATDTLIYRSATCAPGIAEYVLTCTLQPMADNSAATFAEWMRAYRPDAAADQEQICTFTCALTVRNQAVADRLAAEYDCAEVMYIDNTLVGRTLTADLPLDELLQSVADSIHELLGYPNVAIPLIDTNDPDMLVIRFFGGAYRTLVGGVHRQLIDEGIMGAAVRTRQAQLSNDVATDPCYITPPGASGIQAELTVPIVSGEQVLGRLNVESGQRFSEEDAASLQIVADQLSAAITNARLFEARQRRTERLELIARVGQRIAARLDPDELFATTVEELHGRLGYDHTSLSLLDRDDPTWLVKRASG